jgi:ATP-binding cassette subfamily F protein uup
VKLKGKGTAQTVMQDVNGDGLLDQVVKVSTDAFQLSETAAQAVLDKKREATRQASKLKPKKLTWKQQQELDAIPQRLEELESKQAELHRKMADPAFFKQDGAVIADSTRELAAVETDLAQTFEHWQSLEAG